MGAFTEGLITIALAIVGLAMVSVLVSRQANTSGVIQAAASGFGNSLGVAESPVTGNSVAINLSYPNNTLGYGFGT